MLVAFGKDRLRYNRKFWPSALADQDQTSACLGSVFLAIQDAVLDSTECLNFQNDRIQQVYRNASGLTRILTGMLVECLVKSPFSLWSAALKHPLIVQRDNFRVPPSPLQGRNWTR